MNKSEIEHNPIDSNRSALAALTVILLSALSTGALRASTLQFGVVGSPIDLSANVSESILPGATVSTWSSVRTIAAAGPRGASVVSMRSGLVIGSLSARP